MIILIAAGKSFDEIQHSIIQTKFLAREEFLGKKKEFLESSSIEYERHV